MINLGGKKVAKMLVGSSVIYQDSDGWIPLTLPDGVEGLVLFRDNSDGTASLAGSLKFYYVKNNWHELIAAPKGYKFTSIGWSAGRSNGYVNGIVCLDDIVGSIPPSTDILETEIQDGSIWCSKNNLSIRNRNKTLLLTRSSTIDKNSSSLPALINIEKV